MMNPLVGRNNSPKHHTSKVSNQTKDFSLCFVSSGCPRMPGSWHWVALTSIQCSYGTRKCSLGTGSNNSKPQVSSNNPCMVYLNALVIIKAATKIYPIIIPSSHPIESWFIYRDSHNGIYFIMTVILELLSTTSSNNRSFQSSPKLWFAFS